VSQQQGQISVHQTPGRPSLQLVIEHDLAGAFQFAQHIEHIKAREACKTMSPAGALLKLAKCERLIGCQLKHHTQTEGKPNEHATHVRADFLPAGTGLRSLALTVQYDGWTIVLQVTT